MMKVRSLLTAMICAVILTSAWANAEATHFVYLPWINKSTDGPSVPTPEPTATPPNLATLRAQTVAAVNAERQKAGCALVIEEPALTQAAQAWSDYMTAHHIIAHSNSVHADWYGTHGYTATDWVSEVIAGGPNTADAVVALWMSDPPHKATLLTSCENTAAIFHVGVGYSHQAWTLAIGELHN
ncbi:MAG: hypothetical protein OHK0022_07220 [Roseiflexaceae bacterium]